MHRINIDYFLFSRYEWSRLVDPIRSYSFNVNLSNVIFQSLASRWYCSFQLLLLSRMYIQSENSAWLSSSCDYQSSRLKRFLWEIWRQVLGWTWRGQFTQHWWWTYQGKMHIVSFPMFSKEGATVNIKLWLKNMLDLCFEKEKGKRFYLAK